MSQGSDAWQPARDRRGVGEIRGSNSVPMAPIGHEHFPDPIRQLGGRRRLAPDVEKTTDAPRTFEQGEDMTEPELLRNPLLDAREAAELLHVPRSTLYELVRSGGLPHVRIGDRGLRFTRSELERWVGENTYGMRRGR